jgi:hypothetical protein
VIPDPALRRSRGGTLVLVAVIVTGLVFHLVVHVTVFLDATLLDIAIIILAILLIQAFLMVAAVDIVGANGFTLDIGGNPVGAAHSSRASVRSAGRLRMEQRGQRQHDDDSEKCAKHSDFSGN